MAKQKKPTKVDKRVTWITLTEACGAWHIASKSTVIWAYWSQHVMMRKSGKVWLVFVGDMITHFGDPKEPIELNPEV